MASAGWRGCWWPPTRTASPSSPAVGDATSTMWISNGRPRCSTWRPAGRAPRPAGAAAEERQRQDDARPDARRGEARNQAADAMTTSFEMMEALQALALDKGITVDTLLDALPNALVSAYKRMPGAAEAYVTIDAESFEIRVYGQELDEDGNVAREWDDTPDDFGRIAAQTAKQVMTQRIREAEQDMKYEEYAERGVTSSPASSTDRQPLHLARPGQGGGAAPWPSKVPYERPEPGNRLKAYIVEVRRNPRGPQIVVSRTHPGSSSSGCSSSRSPRSPTASWSSRPWLAGPATGPRSQCGPTTTTSTRWVPAWGPGEHGCAWSSTSSGARRSTSCPSPTTSRSSS